MNLLLVIGMLLLGIVQGHCEECRPCELYGQEMCEFSYPCYASSLQLGANYTYANIKVQGKSFHGNLGGLQGYYEYRPSNSLYGGLKAAWKQGTAENSGSHRKLVYIDVQERIGYTYAPSCRDWRVTLFTGFGYRFLGHKLKHGSHRQVKFDYNEFYVPVGILADYSFNCRWSVGLNVTWMPQVYPTVKIVPLKGARWVLKETLDNVLIELPVTWYVTKCKRCSLIFKPFYEHWKDGHSTAKTASGNQLGLPANNYNFWGAELNFAFAF